MAEVGKKYLHVKTGNTYIVTGLCFIEKDWVASVLYRRYDGGPLVVRPVEEFDDGRFKLVE